MTKIEEIQESLQNKTDAELIELWRIGSDWLSKKIMENKDKELIEVGIKKIELIEGELIRRDVEYG